MTTDKERAEVYRELAAELPTVAWVANRFGYRYLCTWQADNREWYIGGPDGASSPGEVTKVEPLRVLGDDEIAVKRFEVDYMGPCDTTAKFMREAANRAAKLDHGSNVTRAVRKVLRGYADALDAEAGGKS